MNPTSSEHYFSPATTLLDAAHQKSSPSFVARARGRNLTFVSNHAVFSKAALDEGTGLLLQYAHIPSEGTLCDLGCGWGAVGAFLATEFPQASIYAVDINPRAAQLATLNFRRMELPNAFAWCGDGLTACRRGFFDTVLCNPPIRAGNAQIEALFCQAHDALLPAGTLQVVIRTAQGAKSWQKKLALLFGNCQTVAIDSGYRILSAGRDGN